MSVSEKTESPVMLTGLFCDSMNDALRATGYGLRVTGYELRAGCFDVADKDHSQGENN